MQEMRSNICLTTDSYKQCHHKQYPADTTKVYSYFEARQGAKYPETVFFGLQYLLKRYLTGIVVTTAMVDEAEELMANHFGADVFDRERWDHIVRFWGGRLPVKIRAVPEGTPVPINNVMMTIENTDPRAYWLTNHLETLLCHVWFPSTVATQSRHAKKICKTYLQETGSDEGLKFMLHDFGYRGTSSNESAAIGGAGHLVNFLGTDTIAAMTLLRQYYDADCPAYSVPATEHSVMTSRGREGEMDVVEQLLDTYPTGILAMVIDSYNYCEFITKVGDRFKDRILARDGKVVFRPDSGNPCVVSSKVLQLLDRNFGSTRNDKGYVELNPKVGMLWGDGINVNDLGNILEYITQEGFAASNMVFGMGGGLLQKINRDVQRFAFKSSYQERDGVGYDIWKDPVDSTKASKRGKLKLVRVGGAHGFAYRTVPIMDELKDELKLVFENGELKKEYALDEIRHRADV